MYVIAQTINHSDPGDETMGPTTTMAETAPTKPIRTVLPPFRWREQREAYRRGVWDQEHGYNQSNKTWSRTHGYSGNADAYERGYQDAALDQVRRRDETKRERE